MKKLLLIILFITSAICSRAQSDTLKAFWGIPFGSQKDVVIKMMAEKGVKLNEAPKSGKSTMLNALHITFSNKPVFIIYLKFINEKFYESSLYYVTSVPHIEDDFNEMVAQINIKYFPGKKSALYKYPYKEGGEEQEHALSSGFGELSCNWEFAKNAISLKNVIVSSKPYLELTYQDTDLLREAQSESIKSSDY